MKTKESMIKNAAILCLATLLAFSAVILIKGWIRGSFRSIDSLRGYVASFGIWAPVVLTLIQLFLTILPVCTSFAGCALTLLTKMDVVKISQLIIIRFLMVEMIILLIQSLMVH